MQLKTLTDLLIHDLKDLYNAEQQLLVAMPKMMDKATAPALKNAINQHFKETQNQVTRLDKVCQILGTDGKGLKCNAMEGLIREGQEFMKEDADPAVMDAGIIGIAQRIEHYEIAGYGTVCTYAKILGLKDVLPLLKETLDEEKSTDEKLTAIAEEMVNPVAR
ncbi:YciE/YciF ferroxidase family protein [Adhaeribacter soli]|uniref:Ferritin-like domain-containing protein n=1 Tax=Adhaeribacter soli TaxID=2607655 RepID=A0A5N1J5G1_9BACT|nr:ferritin-like domain-containing protein [Adhaeribacter soli]KAA9345934.1 ferritin-like domain-containing protein [Adhaeribacter soli]